VENITSAHRFFGYPKMPLEMADVVVKRASERAPGEGKTTYGERVRRERESTREGDGTELELLRF
jgi:hypothetical protein